jgi:hypothetical protein
MACCTASDGLGDFLVLFALQGAEMLVDYGDGVLENLRGAVAVFLSVLVSVLIPVSGERKLLLVMAQLEKQAFAESAATHARRVELANGFEGFLKIGSGEGGFVDRTRGRGCGGVSSA